MRKLLLILVVPVLLAVAFVWNYWQKPRPWELWERTSTPEEVGAWEARYKRCVTPFLDEVMEGTVERLSTLEAEKKACLATVPRLPWKNLSSYKRKDECEQARERNAIDHPKEGHTYECKYNEEKDR